MSVEPSQPLPSSAQPDGLPVPRRYWAIVAILLAICMSVLDSTIANIALPSIASSFRITHAASVWVINAYQVAILVALLPLASLGEVVGYRRISQTGLVVFTVASLGCAFAPSLAVLSVARVVQGLGAAGIMSVNAALVRFTYPQRMLGRAIGINAFVIALSAAIGPTVAAAVLAVAQWRWLFAINVPIGIVAITISLSALPDSERVPRDLSYVSTARMRARSCCSWAVCRPSRTSKRRSSPWPRSPPGASSRTHSYAESSAARLHCYRSICCASVCSGSRSPPPFARSSHRWQRSSRCRSRSSNWGAAPSRRGCS